MARIGVFYSTITGKKMKNSKLILVYALLLIPINLFCIYPQIPVVIIFPPFLIEQEIARNNQIVEQLCTLVKTDSSNQAFKEFADQHKEHLAFQDIQCNWSLVHQAAHSNASQNLKTLLELGKYTPQFLAQRDCVGCTALHCALANNNPEMVRALLEAGSPISWQKRNKKRIRSAVHVALSDLPTPLPGRNKKVHYQQELEKKKRILELLCRYNANFRAKDRRGQTPLQLTQKKPIIKELVPYIKYLIDLKANTTFKDCRLSQNHFPPNDFPADIIGLIEKFVVGQDTQATQ